MSEKRWWMSPGGLSVASAGYQGMEPMWDNEEGTEVRVVPLDAVVLEEGTREWALALHNRGERVSHASARGWPEGVFGEAIRTATGYKWDTGWYLLPAPWVPKKDDRVRWTRGKDSGTATYHKPYNEKPEGHYVFIDGVTVPLWVETVSKLEAKP